MKFNVKNLVEVNKFHLWTFNCDSHIIFFLNLYLVRYSIILIYIRLETTTFGK